MRVIVDTDPGVDDALALAFAASLEPPIDIEAVTTVYGNSSVTNSTRNAGYIAKSLGTEWRIYEGAAEPLEGEGRLAAGCHGESGLGDVVPAADEVTQAQSDSASAFFQRVAEGEDEYTLFGLGPLTNVAEAFTNNPGILNKIGKIVIMGGAFSERGNITEYAEFNAYNDPLAFQIVLDKAKEANIDTTVIPAEVCNKVILTEVDLTELEKGKLLPDLRAIVGRYIGYYLNDGKYSGAVLYDVLVPLYDRHPDLFTTTPVRVAVGQEGERYGQTIATGDDQSSVRICTSVREAEAQAIVLRTLSR